MVLELERIFSGLDSELQFSHTLDWSGMELDGGYPFISPVALNGRVTGQSGVFSLSYEVHFLFRTACSRCMEDFEQEYSFSFRHPLLDAPQEERDDEYLLAEDEPLNLDEVAYTDILLELPAKYLCSPDCKGLCPQCGKNLNEGSCGCVRNTVDPRLEALRELL